MALVASAGLFDIVPAESDFPGIIEELVRVGYSISNVWRFARQGLV